MPQVVIHIVSDALGDTAAKVAEAAVGQFHDQQIEIARFPNARSFDEITSYVTSQRPAMVPIIVLHTLVDRSLRTEFKRWAVRNGIYEVDLIGPVIDALATLTGKRPSEQPGIQHDIGTEYFKRIEAMEFTVNHDDGRNAQDLTKADIVLIGVSRTSKTPLSLVLSMRGFKTANVPLAKEIEPPRELFDVDPRRLFGLMSTLEVLCEIRAKRIGNAVSVASGYVDPLSVQQDLDDARAFMRRLGCIVLRTDKRAVEETAQEIIKHYNAGFGME